MIRYLKCVLMLLVAFWALTALVTSLGGIPHTYKAVHDITVMPMFKPGEGPPFATENPLVIWLGVALIVLGKVATLVPSSMGAVAMFRAVRLDRDGFQRSKQWGIVGCGVGLAWLFLGFATIGENLFFMFLDPIGAGAAAAAFRYAGLLGIIMIFVAMPEQE